MGPIRHIGPIGPIVLNLLLIGPIGPMFRTVLYQHSCNEQSCNTHPTPEWVAEILRDIHGWD